MKKIFLVTFLVLRTFALAKIYIDINQVSSDPFKIAVVEPLSIGGAPESVGQELKSTLEKDFKQLGIFKCLDSKAFLEDPKKPNFETKDIDFSKWALIDALGLIKGSVETKNANTVEVYLRFYDVLGKTKILGKKYQANPSSANIIAHRFANEVVKVLTGNPGVFETQIAFICANPNKEVCVMNFDGSDAKTVTHHSSITLSPIWDKKNDFLYYTSFAGTKYPHVFRLNPRNNRTEKITKLPGQTIGLSLDPIQSLLATTLTKDGNAEIYLINTKGNIERRLTTNLNTIDVSARFSPNGEKIAFVSDRNGSVQIFTMNRDGSGVKQITFKGKNNTSPAWHPSGEKLLFAGMDTDGKFDIFSVDSEGKTLPVRLTYDTQNNQEPTWSPGGQLIAFASNRTGKFQIFTMRPDGSDQKRLHPTTEEQTMPDWQK